MDRYKQMGTFVAVATLGSLSAAARAEGIAPAMIGRRIDALEARLGVKLLARSTRRLSITPEGTAYLEESRRLLRDLEDTENLISQGSRQPSGPLRISAPAGFGRRHVAPLLPGFARAYPDLNITLDLTDRLVDLIEERVDCAVRIGDLVDSGLVGVRLADNRRVVVASPDYLARHGTPEHPDDLMQHRCLSFGTRGNQSRGWLFNLDGRTIALRGGSGMECNDGSVLHAWTLEGEGLSWRSLWEVREDLEAGRLQTVLDDFHAPPNGIFAILPERKHLPSRVRVFVDWLKDAYATQAGWT